MGSVRTGWTSPGLLFSSDGHLLSNDDDSVRWQVQEAGVSAIPLTSWQLPHADPPVQAPLPTGGLGLVVERFAPLGFYHPSLWLPPGMAEVRLGKGMEI